MPIWPWHLNPLIQRINRKRLCAQLKKALEELSITAPRVLAAYPVPVLYLDVPYDKLLYLRLDDYHELPGTDHKLVGATEGEMYKKAHSILVTARHLTPRDATLKEKVSAFARFDHTFDANSSGAGISYIPFDDTASSNFIVAGVDLAPDKNIHIIPNVELVIYGESDSGDTPLAVIPIIVAPAFL